MNQAEEMEKMRFSGQLARQQSPMSDSNGTNKEEDQQIVVPETFIATADGFEKKEDSW